LGFTSKKNKVEVFVPNTYTAVPQTNHTLANDQPPMLADTLYLPNTLRTSLKSGDHQISVGGVDTNSFEGRHIQVCLKSLTGGSQPNVTTIGDGVDSILYSKNGNIWASSSINPSVQYQFTNLTTLTPSADFDKFGITNGWTFLPGGLLMQYGTATVNIAGSSTTISFPISFTSSVFSITIGCINTGGNSPAANNVFIQSGSVEIDQFIATNSSSGTVNTIYWMAIGF
jgi:hypothetical protein